MGQFKHIVQGAYLQRDALCKRFEIETSLTTMAKGMAHKLRKDDGPQIAATIRRQRLFTAVVHHKTVGVEGVHIAHRHVVHRVLTARHQRRDSHGKTFPVEVAFVARQG